jgi:uncharacterized protein (DUF1697 family)
MTMRIALLRGVNVGGNKKVAMADLKAMVEALGFSDVKTLLQSGNVVFRAGDETEAALEAHLEAETERRLGLKTSYLVRDAAQWRAIIDACPFPNEAPSRTLVTVGRTAMPAEAIDAVRAVLLPHEKVEAVERQVYAYFGEGMGQSKAAEALNRKAVKAVATGRNWNTVLKIAALLGV